MTSAYQLQDTYLCLTNLSMIFCIVDKPIAYVPLWKCDFFPILDFAYAILVLCSRQVPIMSKDHPRR